MSMSKCVYCQACGNFSVCPYCLKNGKVVHDEVFPVVERVIPPPVYAAEEETTVGDDIAAPVKKTPKYATEIIAFVEGLNHEKIFKFMGYKK